MLTCNFNVHFSRAIKWLLLLQHNLTSVGRWRENMTVCSSLLMNAMQRACHRLAVSTVYFVEKSKFTIRRNKRGNESALDKFVSSPTQNTIRNFILNFLRLILITCFASSLYVQDVIQFYLLVCTKSLGLTTSL